MERELERVKEREPQMDRYDSLLKWMIQRTKERDEGKVLIKADEVPWQQTRHTMGRHYIGPDQWKEIGAPGWIIARTRTVANYRIGKHTHRGGGRLLFVLEGKGCTINNGVRLDWEEGDLETLPVVVGENEHEHFAEPDRPQSFYVLMFWPFMEATANETRQMRESPDYKGPTDKDLFRPADFVPENARLKGLDIEFNGPPKTLLDDLFLRRNQWRDMASQGRWVIKKKDQPVELNRMGYYRWFIHPAFKDVVMRQILFWTHEIPPGSRSGKQKHQGSRVHYVLEGKGYSVVDGKRYDWEAEDMLILPIRVGGVVVQHFNSDPKVPAKLICTEPNWYDIMGVDMAAGFEQLENCPEFRE